MAFANDTVQMSSLLLFALYNFICDTNIKFLASELFNKYFVIWFFQYVGGNVVTKKLHLMWTRKIDFPSSLFYTCSLWQDFVGLVELWFLEVIILSDSCPVKFCKRLCRESLLWSSFPVCLPLSLFLSVSLCVSSSLLGTFQILFGIFTVLPTSLLLFLPVPPFPLINPSLKTEENFRYSNCIFCGYNDKADDRNIASIYLLLWVFWLMIGNTCHIILRMIQSLSAIKYFL